MSVLIPLNNVPNQSLSINEDDSVYDIEIKALKSLMTATIVRDGVTIVANTRVLPGVPLIPFDYLENGNFIFVNDMTVLSEFPYYSDFVSKYNLIFFTSSELEVLKNA